MTWRAGDPGFPPSPDPAGEAERYYARLEEMSGPDPEDCGGDCGSCRRCKEDREQLREEIADEPTPSEFKPPVMHADDEEVPF